MKVTFEKRKLKKKTLFANKKEIILNKYQQLFLIQRKETFGKRKRNLCMDIDDQRPGPTKSGSRASPLPFQAPAYTWSPVLSAFPFFFLVRARSSLNYDTTRAQNPTAVQHVQPDTNLKNCPVNVGIICPTPSPKPLFILSRAFGPCITITR